MSAYFESARLIDGGLGKQTDAIADESDHFPSKQGELGAPEVQHLVQNGAQCCTLTEGDAPSASPAQELAILPDPVVARRAHLTPRQWRAVALLALGHTDADTGRQVGVHRNTIARWRVQNPFFIVEVNHRTQDLRRSLASRAQLLAVKAMEMVEQEVELNRYYNGQRPADFALRVLRVVGPRRNHGQDAPEQLSAVADQVVRQGRGAKRAEEPVSDEDRNAALMKWMTDPEEGKVPEPEHKVSSDVRLIINEIDTMQEMKRNDPLERMNRAIVESRGNGPEGSERKDPAFMRLCVKSVRESQRRGREIAREKRKRN